MPVVSASCAGVGVLYGIFVHPTIAGHANALLAETLWAVPLGTSLAGAVIAGTVDAVTRGVIGGLVLAIAAVGEVTSRCFRVSVV